MIFLFFFFSVRLIRENGDETGVLGNGSVDNNDLTTKQKQNKNKNHNKLQGNTNNNNSKTFHEPRATWLSQAQVKKVDIFINLKRLTFLNHNLHES